MPLEAPNGRIEYGIGDHRRMSVHVTTIANQQVRMWDGTVGPDLAADSDHTISFASGTTYMSTMHLTADRVVKVPSSGIADNEQLWLRFNHIGGAADKLEVRDLTTNVLIAHVQGTPVDEGLCIRWDASEWRCLNWTTNVVVAQ